MSGRQLLKLKQLTLFPNNRASHLYTLKLEKKILYLNN